MVQRSSLLVGDLLIGAMEELALHIPHLLSHLENQNIKKSSLEKESDRS